MAKLTDSLGVVTSGKDTVTNRATGGGGGIFGALLKGASQVGEAVEGAAATRAKAAQRERQMRLDARTDIENQREDVEWADKQENKNAVNATLAGLLEIGSGGASEITTIQKAEMPPAIAGELEGAPEQLPVNARNMADAANEAQSVGNKVEVMQAAVQQGRMSEAAYELQLESLMRSVFSKFPNSRAAVFEVLDKYAIKHPIMSEYRDAQEANDYDRDQGRKRREAHISKALEAGYSPTEYDEDALVAIGGRVAKNEYDLKEIRAQAQDARAQAGEDRVKRQEFQKVNSEKLGVWVESSLRPDLGDAISTFTALSTNESIPPEERLKRLAPLLNTFMIKGRAKVDQTILRAQQEGMDATEAERVRRSMYQQIDEATAVFNPSNPVNILAVEAKSLATIQARAGLAAHEAMPLYTQMRQMFGNAEGLAAHVETVFANPKIASALAREMKGFQGLQDGQQTIRLKNSLAIILDENTQLRDLPPDQRGQALNDSVQTLRGLYPSAMKGNSQSAYQASNILGKISNLAVDQTVATDINSLVRASEYLAGSGSLQILNRVMANPEQREFGGVVTDAARVAVQKNLVNLRAKDTGDPHFRVVYDVGARRFNVVKKPGAPDTLPRPGYAGSVMGKTEGAPRIPVAASKAIIAKRDALNRNLSFLDKSTVHEDNAQIKGLNAVERAKFYATGQRPASMMKEGKPVASWDEGVAKLTKFWDEVNVDWDSKPYDPAREAADATGYGATPEAKSGLAFFTSRGWTPAQAAGIVGNLQAESGASFQQRNKAGDGGKAIGIAQWHPDRQARFEQQMGKDVREATIEEQFAFVDWELRNTEGKAGERLRAAKTAEEAAEIIDQYYERSSGVHRGKRIANARALMGD